MVIPEKFKLYGHTITVESHDEVLNEKDYVGLTVPELLSIALSLTNDEGKKRKPTLILETYYHEKVHMILRMMNEDKLYKNEKFVDEFANLLLQSDLTSEGELLKINFNTKSKKQNIENEVG